MKQDNESCSTDWLAVEVRLPMMIDVLETRYVDDTFKLDKRQAGKQLHLLLPGSSGRYP